MLYIMKDCIYNLKKKSVIEMVKMSGGRSAAKGSALPSG